MDSHFERDAVVEVDSTLNIIEVGVALANDNSTLVASCCSPDAF